MQQYKLTAHHTSPPGAADLEVLVVVPQLVPHQGEAGVHSQRRLRQCRFRVKGAKAQNQAVAGNFKLTCMSPVAKIFLVRPP